MLNNAIVRGAEPRDVPYKLADEKGLYLYVTPAGAKSWRMKFRFGRKEQLLTFGLFPEVSLAQARTQRDDARQDLRRHVNPSGARKRARTAAAEADTFEAHARAWHVELVSTWSTRHAEDVMRSLERDVFPAIGAKALGEIDRRDVRELLRKVEDRGAPETARRIRQRISGVFEQAIDDGAAAVNPATAKARKRTVRVRRKQAAATKLEPVRALLAAVEAAAGNELTKLASTLLALTVVRPAVVRGATWSEFEGIEGIDRSPFEVSPPIWRIPAARMKLTLERKSDVAFEHVVPLSRQAVELLQRIRAGQTARKPESQISGLLFPNRRDRRRPLSKNAIGDLYRRAGYAGRHVPHGWRAAFSTIMNHRHRADRAVIDLALAHQPKDKVEAAYNRAEHLERRAELLQEWADLLLIGN